MAIRQKKDLFTAAHRNFWLTIITLRNKWYNFKTPIAIRKKTEHKVVNASDFNELISGEISEKVIRFKSGFKLIVKQKDAPAVAETCILQDYFQSKKCQIKPGDIVLDIGGHIGSFSVLAAHKGAKVYAFEPDMPNFKELVKNIKLNHMEKQIVAVNAAIGAKTKKGYLHTDLQNTAGHSISTKKGKLDSRIQIYSLEDVFAKYAIPRIDFIKMDIEGAEYDLLPSITNVCWAKITCIVGEYHIAWSTRKNNYAKIKKILSPHFKRIERTAPYYFFASKN